MSDMQPLLTPPTWPKVVMSDYHSLNSASRVFIYYCCTASAVNGVSHNSSYLLFCSSLVFFAFLGVLAKNCAAVAASEQSSANVRRPPLSLSRFYSLHPFSPRIHLRFPPFPPL